MQFSYFFVTNFCAMCFCILLKFTQSDEVNGSSEVTNSSSREKIQPTPLILHLNRSAADELIEQANRMFVSNTSFDDIVNDNNTYQMLLRYRERHRAFRLMSIQQEILLKLGLEQGPNVTAKISEEEGINLMSTYDRLSELQGSNDTVTVE